MIRKINVVHFKDKNSNIQDFNNILISDIDNIVNFSVDVLYCAAINQIDSNRIQSFLENILKKIRLGGQLTVVVNDVRQICQTFLNRQITEEKFFQIVNENKNSISEEQIIRLILETNMFNIIGIEKDKSIVSLSFIRKSND